MYLKRMAIFDIKKPKQIKKNKSLNILQQVVMLMGTRSAERGKRRREIQIEDKKKIKMYYCKRFRRCRK